MADHERLHRVGHLVGREQVGANNDGWGMGERTGDGRIVGSRISINHGGARPTQHRAWVMHCQLSFTEVSGRHAVFCFMGRHVRQQIDEPQLGTQLT